MVLYRGCIKDESPGNALSKLTSLRHVSLAGNAHVRESVLHVLGTLTNLQSLDLFECGEDIGDAGLLALSGLTGLTTLDLSYSCWQATPQGFARLLREVGGLRELRLRGCDYVNDEVA